MWTLSALSALLLLPTAVVSEADGGSAATFAGRDLSLAPFQVLITGFGPFLNFTHNPTEAVARALGSECQAVVIRPEPGRVDPGADVRLRVCWHAVVLPVNRSGALWSTRHLNSVVDPQGNVPYHAVFHMGLEDVAKGLKLEVAAANIQAEDGTTVEAPAVRGAQHLLATTVNTGWFTLSRLRSGVSETSFANVTELWSRDPGKFYCNEVYFRTLDLIRTRTISASTGALLPAMFVHLPNSSTVGVNGDVETIRQVVGHALWSTYLAPNHIQNGHTLGLLTSPSDNHISWMLIAILTGSNAYLAAALRRRRPAEALMAGSSCALG